MQLMKTSVLLLIAMAIIVQIESSNRVAAAVASTAKAAECGPNPMSTIATVARRTGKYARTCLMYNIVLLAGFHDVQAWQCDKRGAYKPYS
jgi:hypothetical protein